MNVMTPYQSPFGTLEIEASAEGISAIRWPLSSDTNQQDPYLTIGPVGSSENPLLETAKTQLDEYF